MKHLTQVTKVILGTVQFGTRYGINNQGGQPSTSRVFEIFDFARKVGIACLDTAEDYGTAQQVIGEYHLTHIHHKQRSFDIISKLSHNFNGISIEKHLRSSLEILKIPNLEGYLFHSYFMFKDSPELLEELLELREHGLIKKIGVSIYTNEQLSDLIQNESCDIIQIPLNLLDNLTQKGDLLEKAKTAGKEIHVRSVYLQGLFFMDASLIPGRLHPLVPYLNQIKCLAEEASISLSSLALQYIVNNPNVDKMLIGVDSVEQLIENVEALSTPLDKAIFKEIDKIQVKETLLLNPVNWK